MILLIIAFILPPACLLIVGLLLIAIPQKEIARHFYLSHKRYRPGEEVKTSAGLIGTVLNSTSTHVVITAPDGHKHEILKLLVSPHETGV